MPIRLKSATAVVGGLSPTLENGLANFDGSNVSPGSFTGAFSANLQNDTALLQGNYQAVSDITGTLSDTLEGFSGTLTDSTAQTNAQRISAILAGRTPHFSYSNPADPVTTRQVTVHNATDFNTEAAVAGTQITVGSSFSGNIQFGASDLDIIMSNSLSITGNLQSSGATQGSPHERIRWTGGNIGTIDIFYVNDLLFDDVFCLTDNATKIWDYPQNRIGVSGTCNRGFCINSTFRIESNSGDNGWWAMTIAGTDGNRSADMFFGNVLFDGNQYAQTTRTHGCNRYMAVDCVYSPNILVTNGSRWHESTDVWVKDSWCEGEINNRVTASSSAPSVANGLFDGFDNYNGYYLVTDATNTGEVRNSTLYGGTISFSPYTDGGGNSSESWDGSTLPDYSNVGAIRP